MPGQSHQVLTDWSVTPSLLTELKILNGRKATGLDNLPPGLLKDAAGVIAKPLTFIINLSLETGVVPTEWKMAKVIPIFKSGSLAEIDNYRPIINSPYSVQDFRENGAQTINENISNSTVFSLNISLVFAPIAQRN